MRSLIGFAVFAVLGIFLFKVVMGLLSGLLGLFITLAVWAFFGWVMFLLLKMVAPETASRIRETITGKAA